MRKMLTVATTALISPLALSAQGGGRHPTGSTPQSTPGSLHSNAPAGTSAASADRDKGQARAEDVGKGEKKGLKKSKHNSRKKGK